MKTNKVIENLKYYIMQQKENQLLWQVENIVTEVIDNLSTSQPFVIHTSFIGDIEMGNGLIKANIPFTNKKLVLNRSDLDSLKDILTSNQL